MIDAKELNHRQLNEKIKASAKSGNVEVVNVDGQRYIGIGLKEINLAVRGIPGNDLGMFLDGASILVEGNAEDGVGNTMNSGNILVKGHAEDIVGYAMRGGSILIKNNAGYRVGVCMKGFGEIIPVIIVGGNVKDFLGEYMSGGRIIVLGKTGNYIGTGMHGGIIFIKGKVEASQLGFGAVIEQLTEWDHNEIRRCLEPFCKSFGLDVNEITKEEFTKIVPVNNRPYMSKYC